MSTPTGQSRLQPLHDRHRSSASATSGARHPALITSPFAISNSSRARPRVECCSSPVARKLGHITPPDAVTHPPDAEAPAAGPGERAAVLGERERLPSAKVGQPDEHPQVLVQLRGPHDPAGVHLVVRVPDALELRERVDDLRRVHAGQQLGAGHAVAVLARERPAVRNGQVRRVLHERAEVGDASLVSRSKSIRMCRQPSPKWP